MAMNYTPRSLSGKIYFEEIGNWAQLVGALDTLPKRVKDEAFDSMRHYGYKYERLLKRNIRNNGSNFNPPWPWYTLKYFIYKSTHSPKPAYGAMAMYRWTGNLYQSVYSKTTRANHTVVVSIRPTYAGRKKRSKELNAAQIALVLDAGSVSHNIAPRPLFYPTWKMMGGERAFAEYVSSAINKLVINHLSNIR
jgi:hypothetical protein